MPAFDIGDQAIDCTEHGVGEALVTVTDDLHASAAYDGEMAHLGDRFIAQSPRHFGRAAGQGALVP